MKTHDTTSKTVGAHNRATAQNTESTHSESSEEIRGHAWFENEKGVALLDEQTVNYLQKRMGPRVWDGILFDPKIATRYRFIFPNETGKEIRHILSLYSTKAEMVADT